MDKITQAKIRTFVVDRTRWARGGKNGIPMIVPNDVGALCCLGFAREQCGLTRAEIRGESAADLCDVLPEHAHKLPAGLVGYWVEYATGKQFVRHMTKRGGELQYINDFGSESDAVREAKLNEIAAQGPEPFRFVFVDGSEEYARALAEAQSDAL